MRRRSLLRVIGLGGLAGISSTGGAAIATDVADQFRSLVLLSPYLSSSVPANSIPEVGRSSVLSGPLLSEDGVAIGRFHSSRMVLQSGSAVEVTYFDQHMFCFDGGTLFGSGHATRNRDTADEFAVSGGVGTFLRAGGSYHMYCNATDSGGDGSVRFEMDLIGGW